jgi:hypothetical protein
MSLQGDSTGKRNAKAKAVVTNNTAFFSISSV